MSKSKTKDQLLHEHELKDRTGETSINAFGSKMIIINYNNAMNITVKFENGFESTGRYDQFKKGNFRNPYDRAIDGVGYLGEGKYRTNEYRRIKRVWRDMLKRCYNKNWNAKHFSYHGCTVCEEWHNLQNFAKWYEENYYEIREEEMQLDKDILNRYPNIYSPDNCLIVPKSINTLFIRSKKARGNFPIGVSYDKSAMKFKSYCGENGRAVHLGLFNCQIEAFISHKKYKECIIKKKAKDYEHVIPKALFNAMISFTVLIDD